MINAMMKRYLKAWPQPDILKNFLSEKSDFLMEKKIFKKNFFGERIQKNQKFSKGARENFWKGFEKWLNRKRGKIKRNDNL